MLIEFDIKLKAKDVFRFNLDQTYTSFNGWSSLLFAAVLFGMAGYSIVTQNMEIQPKVFLYIFAGVLLLLYLPCTLWLRSRQSLNASPVLNNMLHYQVDTDGFTVTQGEAKGVLPWKQIYKMVATKHLVLVYSNRINAYIIPRRQLDGQYVALAKLAVSKLPKFRVRMKVTIKDI